MSFSPKQQQHVSSCPTTSVTQTCLRWFLSAIPFNWARWLSPLHGFHGIYQKGWNDFEGKDVMRDYVTFSKFTTTPWLGDIFSNFRCLRVVFKWAFVSSLQLWKLFHDKNLHFALSKRVLVVIFATVIWQLQHIAWHYFQSSIIKLFIGFIRRRLEALTIHCSLLTISQTH